jgi:hypothetical protein
MGDGLGFDAVQHGKRGIVLRSTAGLVHRSDDDKSVFL